jgi:hypothetical protein
LSIHLSYAISLERLSFLNQEFKEGEHVNQNCRNTTAVS